MPLVSLRGVSKTFVTAAGPFLALRDINLDLYKGCMVAIVGRSGSGKSTLLNLVAGLDRPSSGEIHVADQRIDTLGEDALAIFRGVQIGVVFQFFQLLPTLSVLENIILPMDFVKAIPNDKRRQRALELLDRVGIVDQAEKLPSALSGGQQQRAAIARALANDPGLIVADEPTGNLDSHTGEEVLNLFRNLANEGKTVLIVTHDLSIERRVDRVIELADGVIVRDDEIRLKLESAS